MADVTMKRCRKCGEEYPATREYFSKHENGLRNDCKACACEYARRYAQEHADKIREDARLYYQEHADELREYARLHAQEHADEAREYARLYRQEHLDAERERGRRFHHEHADEISEYKRRYQKEHGDKMRERKRLYYQEHPEVMRVINHRRRARKLGNGGSHTAADIHLQIAAQTDKRGRLFCWWCFKEIKGGYHVDHRIPLSKGGSNGAENIVIAHPRCNLSKNDKLPQELGRLF